MYQHHDGPDSSARFEDKNPTAIEKQKHGKQELDAAPESLDVVYPVV